MVLDLFLVSSAKIMSELGTLSLKIKLSFLILIAQSFIHALKYVMFSLHSCYVSSYPSGICRGYSGRIFSIRNNRV